MSDRISRYCTRKNEEVRLDATTGCQSGHYDCDAADCMYSPAMNLANGIARILYGSEPKGRDYTTTAAAGKKAVNSSGTGGLSPARPSAESRPIAESRRDAEGWPNQMSPKPASADTGMSRRLQALFLVAGPLGLLFGAFLLYLAYTTAHEVLLLRSHGEVAEARIVERHKDGRIKYRFRATEGGAEYFRSQLGSEIWSEGRYAAGNNVSVRYSLTDPFCNRPASMPTPDGDEIGGIILAGLCGVLPFLLLAGFIASQHTQAKKIVATLYVGYTALLAVSALGGVLVGMIVARL
jgi:hypothetical protein